MATVINMPRLSDTMEEGVVAKWNKKVGDTVKSGDILAEIETDKATMDFESFYDGVLLHIGVQEGEAAPVDTLLAIIGEKGEDISDLIKNPKEKSTETTEEKKEASTPKDTAEQPQAELPQGIEIIRMPRLSDTMEEGTVAKWNKKEGDSVKSGEILAEIETDKATMDFESFYDGTLLKIGIPEGQSAPVDSVLAIIGPSGTDVSSIDLSQLDSTNSTTESTTAKEEKQEAKTETKTETQSSVASIKPRAKESLFLP
jgi:pyruvate dehydrogenase E2 component (dihydrolipoamide acetyltransferase)